MSKTTYYEAEQLTFQLSVEPIPEERTVLLDLDTFYRALRSKNKSTRIEFRSVQTEFQFHEVA